MISYLIIILNFITSAKAFNDRALFYKFMFSPYIIDKEKKYYRFFSYAFIHADWSHLFFNMFTLFFFGPYVEKAFYSFWNAFGILVFVILFFAATAISSLSDFYKYRNNSYYSAVGASGAISAVLFSYILINPLGKIYLFFIPIGIPAFIFGIIYLLISAYFARKGNDNIGHNAHFWGAVFGFIFPILLKPDLFVLFIKNIFSKTLI